MGNCHIKKSSIIPSLFTNLESDKYKKEEKRILRVLEVLDEMKDNIEIRSSQFKILRELKKSKNSRSWMINMFYYKNPLVIKSIECKSSYKSISFYNECVSIVSTYIQSIIPMKSEYFDKSNRMYLIIPYYECGSIETLIPSFLQDTESNKNDIVYSIITDICNNLKYLSKYNIYHGNIKPSNILVDNNNGSFLMTDYCKYIINNYEDDDDENDTLYEYKSPEMLCGKEYNHSTDMFSLGCLLHYIITGKHLFIGKNRNEAKLMVLNGRINNEVDKNHSYYKLMMKLISEFPYSRPNIEEALSEINKIKQKMNQSVMKDVNVCLFIGNDFKFEKNNINDILHHKFLKKSVICDYIKYKNSRALFFCLNMLWEDNSYDNKYTMSQEFDLYEKFEKCTLKEYGIDSILLQSIRKNYVLNLCRQKISDAGCKYICDNIQVIQHLQILDIESSNTCDEGIMYLSDKFNYLKDLKELNIRSNPIHKSAILYFFRKLSILHGLKALSMGSTGLDDDSFRGYIKNIKLLPNLEFIDVSGNELTYDGMVEYTEHFDEYSSLHELDLSNIKYDKKTTNLLLNKIDRIKSLQHLIISECIKETEEYTSFKKRTSLKITYNHRDRDLLYNLMNVR